MIISFQSVYTASGYEYIYAFDGYDNTSSTIVVLSGYNPPRQPYYASTQTYMFLQFTSNYYYYGSFYATFYASGIAMSHVTLGTRNVIVIDRTRVRRVGLYNV